MTEDDRKAIVKEYLSDEDEDQEKDMKWNSNFSFAFTLLVIICLSLYSLWIQSENTKEILKSNELLGLKIDSARTELKGLQRNPISLFHTVDRIDSTQKDYLAWWDIFKQDHAFENAAIEAKLAEDRKPAK